MHTPILFMIFNRPDVTGRVFEAIRAARPSRLYVAADGPRAHAPKDAVACAETRKIIEGVDWACEVRLLMREANLGCKRAVSSAIDWFFEQEENGIILEDDCLPDPTFFPFCERLLERYRDDDRVMQISGDNFQFGNRRGDGSYYFSIYNHIWGWATWRRAWKHYDLNMAKLPEFIDKGSINGILDDQDARNSWLHHFISSYHGEINTWDYQWTFAVWERGGMTILPNVNLVSNIGFGEEATFCQHTDSPLANMKAHPIHEIVHPSTISVDREADRFTTDYVFLGKKMPVEAQAITCTEPRSAAMEESLTPQTRGNQMLTEAASNLTSKANHQQGRPIKAMPVAGQVQRPAAEGAAALTDKAVALLSGGRVEEAFQVLIQAKGLKTPLIGLDLLRAHCFLRMGQPQGAQEALREELRYFPANREAIGMLEELQRQLPAPGVTAPAGIEPEFRELLQAIRPFTMLSEERLHSLYTLARSVCERDLPGNFVECGVAAGGSSALLAFVIKRYSKKPRRLFSFDSFSGMPEPTKLDSHLGIDAEATGWGTGTCAAPEESVREICAKLGVAELVTTVKGYFEETLPRLRDWTGMVAMLHLDGDWYSSTKAILDNLYDRLLHGAILQVDDYGYWDGCRKAVHEFESARALNFAIKPIDGTGVWFEKPDPFPVNAAIERQLIEEFNQDDPVPKGITSQMSPNERFQLYHALRKELPAGGSLVRFVEIGSYSGASLLLIHQALRRTGRSFQGITVEPGGTAQFHELVKILKDDVIHLPMFSHEAAKRLEAMLELQRLPQFIFVDGDHTYQGVRQDILDFYPLLQPGGVMLFHDYLPALDERNRPFILHHHGNAEPGIRQACQELMEETYGCQRIELPLLFPTDPTQTQPQLPIIPGVFSTVRAYRKPC